MVGWLVLTASSGGASPVSAPASPKKLVHTTGSPKPVGTKLLHASDPAKAFVTDNNANKITPINLSTGRAGTPISVPGGPSGISLTPNGKTAYVTATNDNTVVSVDLSTGALGTPVSVPDLGVSIAITPDGQTAYVTAALGGGITPINLATQTVGQPISVPNSVGAVAVTPDGKTAYVADVGGTVTPVDLATGTAGTPISVPGGPAGIAFAPDGKTAYVAETSSDSVTPIHLATGTVGSSIAIPTGVQGGIAITPDGKTVYVTSGFGSILPITLANRARGTAINVPFGDGAGLAIAPHTPPASTCPYLTATEVSAVATEPVTVSSLAPMAGQIDSTDPNSPPIATECTFNGRANPGPGKFPYDTSVDLTLTAGVADASSAFSIIRNAEATLGPSPPVDASGIGDAAFFLPLEDSDLVPTLFFVADQRIVVIRLQTSLGSTGTGLGPAWDALRILGRDVIAALKREGSSTYVAMGDSYSSGEGADWPPGGVPQEQGCDWWLYQDPSGTPKNTDHLDNSHHFGLPRCFSPNPKDQRGDTCHRAITAYPHVLMRLLGNPNLKLKFVACSGDTIHAAITGQRDNTRQGEHSQLAALNSDTSLVTLTLSGNDLGFAGNAKTCVTPGQNEWDCLSVDPDLLSKLGYNTTPDGQNDGKFGIPAAASRLTYPPAGLTPQNLNSTISDLDGALNNLDVHDRLILVYRTIHKLAPNARILVLGYPRFFPIDAPAAAHFSSQEAQWLNDRITVVDNVIHDAAQKSGVAQYVDVYNALSGHELGTGDPQFDVQQSGAVTCTGGAYINDIDLPHGEFGSPELLHPNPCGHQAEGQLAAAAYVQSSSAPFSLPQLPPAGVITPTDHHGNFPVGCHATFSAPVNSARSDAIAGYTWFDKTGNERGTGPELGMDSVHNDFQLYLLTTGANGQDRYSFFHGSVC